MTDASQPFSPPDGGRHLVAQVQGLGFESARLVVSRFTEMFERFQTGFGAALGAGEFRMPEITGFRSSPVESSALLLPDVAPGGGCTAHMWLHNPTASPASRLRFWLPGLLTHDGLTIDPSSVAFSPPDVASIDADSSIPVLVILSLPRDARPGRYHGQVLVEGQPETSLPISFNVVASAD